MQAQVHRHVHNFREVQQCTLLSIKTGGCSEDCSYCPQSSRYSTGLKAQKLMNSDAVLEAAKKVRFIIIFIFVGSYCFLLSGYSKNQRVEKSCLKLIVICTAAVVVKNKWYENYDFHGFFHWSYL